MLETRAAATLNDLHTGGAVPALSVNIKTPEAGGKQMRVKVKYATPVTCMIIESLSDTDVI
jgi:hypothetical protein